MSLRTARALLWLHWRILVNRLTKATHRDDLEQVSRWGEAVLRLLLVALALPAVVAAALVAAVGGWFAARSADAAVTVAIVAGFALAVPLVWMLVRPIAMLSTGGVERSVLLRLLPIPDHLLRNAELVRAMADPVFAIFAPAVLLFPVGAAVGGNVPLAVTALLAGVAYLAFIATVGALMVVGAHLLLRGRRRAELVTLVFLVVISAVSVLPQAFLPPRGRRSAAPLAAPAASAGRRPLGERGIPAALRPLPPAAYAAALLDAGTRRWGLAALDVALLAAAVGVLYLLTIPLYARLTGSPEGGGGPAGAATMPRRLRLPFVSPATAAVAAAEARALLRTVRGKMALLYPPMMVVMLAIVFANRGDELEGFRMGPTMLAAFAVFGAVASSGVFACNLFAIHGSGLVLELVMPLSGRSLAAGKALAVGAMVAAALLLALLPGPVLFADASPAIWLAFWLAGMAAYAAATPAAVVLSALFPKPVELSRLGRAGQPNAAASLLYLLAAAVAAAPAAVAILVALHVLEMVWAAPLLLALYVAAALLLARLLMPLAERLVASRRENLALVAVGR